MTDHPGRVPGDVLVGPLVFWTMRATPGTSLVGTVRQDGRLVGAALRIGRRLICVVAKPTIPAYRKQATR